MPLGRLVRVPRKPPAAPDEQCVCALSLDALLLPAEGTDGKPRALEWPVPRCMTHELHSALPRAHQDTPWRPLFATDIDGFSLAQLQRKTERADGPCLLVAVAVHVDDALGHSTGSASDGAAKAAAEGPTVEPTQTSTRRTLRANECVIGAYMSDPPAATHGAHTFFGTDDTFAFAFPPASDAAASGGFRCGMRAHRWREHHANKEFLLSSHHCIGVGGGRDGAALYLSSDLQHGTTSLHCETFDCGPLVPGKSHGLRHVDFRVHRLWLFCLDSREYTGMTSIAPQHLTAHSKPTPTESDSNGDGAATSGEPAFSPKAYATPHCPAAASGHHRCRFIAEALHLHGADARQFNHNH